MKSSPEVEKPLRILLLEDDPFDTELILREIRKSALTQVTKCVEVHDDFAKALTDFAPDIILSDYKLPGFTGIDALEIVRRECPNVPIILVTGALGEELAVETIKRGVTDYVLKDRISRLVPAISRALREAEQRLQRQRAEELVQQQYHQLQLQNEALQRARRELEVSRERYAHLYDTAPIGYTNLSEEGIICEINSTAAQLLGREATDLIGASFREYVRPPDGNKFVEHLASCARHAGPVRTELTLAPRGRNPRVVELFSVSAREPEQQIRFCQTAITDITELTRSGDTLRESEERFRQLAENIREVFWITDPTKRQMIYVSPGYETIWGRTCESLYSTPESWIEALHPDDRPRVAEAAFTRQISGEYDEVYRIIRPNGAVRWIHDRAFPIRNNSGEVYRIVGIAEDISDRKHVEESLRESEARQHAIVQSALDGVITIDHLGRITDFNPAAEKIFGCTRSRMIGKEMVLVIIPPSLRAWFLRGLAEMFAANEGPVCGGRIEMIGLRCDGTEFPIECTITRIELEGPPMFTAFIRDISGRKRAEEQIRLLADAVQSTQELIFITDQEGRFTFLNRAFLDAYGYSELEVRGRKADFLYAASNPPGLREQVIEQTLAGGWRGEILQRRKDGSEFPISLSTSQIKMASGKLLGFVGVAQDISERKRAEKENTAFLQLGYRLSAATTPEDAANIIMEIASELFGWDAGYVHLCAAGGDKLIPVLTIDTLDGKRTPVQPTTFTHDPSPLMRAVMKEGARLVNRPTDSRATTNLVPFGDTSRPSASMMYVPIHSSGAVLGILSIQSYAPRAYSGRDLHLLQTLANHCGDTVRRIEVSEALREAEAQFRALFESAPIGIALHDTHGRYIHINHAYQAMLGYTAEELKRLGVKGVTRTEDVTEGQRLFEELRKGTRDFYRREKRYLRSDGGEVWAESSASAVRDHSSKLHYIISMVEDITERKRAERDLRLLPQRIIEAQENERLRVARELHDGVNQLIASVKMRLRRVEDQVNPAAREILRRCSELLVLALAENRRIAYDLRPGDLDELGLAVACKHFCTDFQARTSLKVKSQVPRLWSRLAPATELNLFRIVQEALTNVEKHARAKTVWLRLAVDDEVVRLTIRDDGRGFLLNDSKVAKKRGTGLGLTNMRERVASAGGTCELISSPKKGTTITVRVPQKLKP